MLSWLTSRAFPFGRKTEARVDDLLTPFPEVVEELKRRNADEALKARVQEYLNDDLPPYFKKEPVLYLARHIATPNFETLRFMHLVETTGIQTVIGQDVKDRFVAHNHLKRKLAKLPICLGITKSEEGCTERYQNMTIVDFNAANGKRFDSIRTLWGENLVDFHTNLLAQFANEKVEIVDDSNWIDANDRGNLLEHYKKFLACFIAHGILFEDYLVENKHEGLFVREVLRPAFKFVEKEFGYRPLITQLTPTSIESSDYWESYPKEVLDIVQQKLST